MLCDRTTMIKVAVKEFRDLGVGLPDEPIFVDELSRHFRCLAPVIKDENGRTFETIESLHDDDHLVHASNYALMGLDYLQGMSNDIEVFY